MQYVIAPLFCQLVDSFTHLYQVQLQFILLVILLVALLSAFVS